MSNTRFDILFHTTFTCWFSQDFYLLYYFFLPAIATALPLRVRALFLVFCPPKGWVLLTKRVGSVYMMTVPVPT